MINSEPSDQYPSIHPQRQEEMLETRRNILKEYSFFKRNYLHNVEMLFKFSLLEKKIRRGLPLRGYFSRKIFEYICHSNNHNIKTDNHIFLNKLPFVVESVMTIQYYHNQILDGKAGVNSKDSISQNLLLSNLLKERLYSYIKDCFGIYTDTVETQVKKMFEWVDIGQLIELKFNKYKDYLQKKLPKTTLHNEYTIPETTINTLMAFIACPSEKKAFIKWYLQRIYLTSAGLFKLTAELISKILNVKDLNIVQYSIYYGMMLQIVNDNSDFIPSKYNHKTVGKEECDSFSDLKNKNITLPIFIHLNEHKKGPVLQYLEKGSLRTKKWEDCLFNDIILSKTIFKSIDIGKEVGLVATSYLDKDNIHTWAFQDMVNISVFNRFYYHYYKNQFIKRIYLSNFMNIYKN